jgi:ABC-type sulfate/molybdate transport systems ATPase subunit
VAIARALASEPEALLLDEPFAALDPHLRRRMEEQLRTDLAGFGGPVLMVTHDMEEAFRFCARLVVLERSFHLVGIDVDRERCADEVAAFVETTLAAGRGGQGGAAWRPT